MAGQKFQYDESGNTFLYFLLSFLAFILFPCTYYFWPTPEDKSKWSSLSIRDYTVEASSRLPDVDSRNNTLFTLYKDNETKSHFIIFQTLSLVWQWKLEPYTIQYKHRELVLSRSDAIAGRNGKNSILSLSSTIPVPRGISILSK